MVITEINAASHCITENTIADFVRSEEENGTAESTVRRHKGALKALCAYLGDDLLITKARLLEWRLSMENSGYASATVLNHVKSINRYLGFAGCPDLRFTRGRSKDISGMEFGYLKAVEQTGKSSRGDNVWLFECKCGNTVELPASRVVSGNTLSCGCLRGAAMKASRKYFDGTSIVQSMADVTVNPNSSSGYVGVSQKRGKWQAYITYKGVHYSLGAYVNVEDAVKARSRAKELVIADAAGLLDFYTELEKLLPQLPDKNSISEKEIERKAWTVNNGPNSAAVRSDNKSGCKGVYYHKGMWEARICYLGCRFYLGRFAAKEDAVIARQTAEQDLSHAPSEFLKAYSQMFSYHLVNSKGAGVM